VHPVAVVAHANQATVETIAFALSVMVVTYTVQDGKSNYLEGAMLLGLYLIIAVAFWASPGETLDKPLGMLTGQ
jgi:Ca2+:H+ antiporter